MPFRIGTIERQRTVKTLARNLYQLDDTPELQARAEEALLKANPGLGLEGGLKRGTPVVVPPLRGGPESAASRSTREATASPAGRAMEDLEALKPAIERHLNAAINEAKESSARLDSREFRTLIARTRPDLAQEIEGIKEASENSIREINERAGEITDVLARAAEDIKRLQAIADRG